MRKKQYYTPAEIITDQYTSGLQYMTENRVEYVGLYHKYLTGEIYTESKYNKNKSKILIPYETESIDIRLFKLNKPRLKTRFQTPSNYKISITNKDIKNKSITRYILKNVSDQKLIEIDLNTLKLYQTKKIDNNLYQLATIKWVITGPVNTINIGLVTKIGVVEQNISEVQQKAKKMPELLKYFPSYSQYYTDTTYSISSNIN